MHVEKAYLTTDRMEFMKKTCIILLILVYLLIFLFGCSQREKTDNGALFHESNTILNQMEQSKQPSEDIEMLPCTFCSVDEMVSHIKESSCEKTKDSIENDVKLGSITYFYAPTVSTFPGYQLFQINVLLDYIIYYFTPCDETNKAFSYESGITVTYCRHEDITLSTLSNQVGIPISDNEFLYDSDRGDISFLAETSVITIHVPKILNDYVKLKSFCSVEKITID